MSAVIDGNIYQLQFRLHDNRYANSPKAVRAGGGYLRSDLLSLGELGFDPVNYVLSIGVGATRGLNVISGDFNGNLRADKTPLRTRGKQQFLYHNRAVQNGITKIEVSSFKLKVTYGFIIQNPIGVPVVAFGHEHFRAIVSMMTQLQSSLTLAASDDLTNEDIATLFDTPGARDLTRTSPVFPEIYGIDANLFLNSENFAADAINSQSVTNLALNSREVNAVTYALSGVTATSNVIAPLSTRDDSLSDLITEQASNTAHSWTQVADITGITANQAVTLHRKIRPNGRTRYRTFFPVDYKSVTGAEAIFDLTGDGSVISTTGGSTARIIKMANGWYWIAHTATGDSGVTTALLTESMLDNSNNSTYIGDGVSGVYVDEFQVEMGVIAHPAVDTTAAQVTSTVKRAKLTAAQAQNFDTRVTMSRLANLLGDPLINSVYLQKSTTVPAGYKYCTSIILRKGTSPVSTLMLSFTGGASPVLEALAAINWTTFAVTLTLPSASWQGGLIPMGNNCYRLWLSGPSVDHTTIVSRVYVRDQTTTHVFLEDVFIGSFMANKGYYPQPYISRGAT